MPSAAGLARSIYDKAPASLKRPLRWIPLGWRIGPVYRRTLDFLLRSDRWSGRELRADQDRRLSEILERAIRNVPHYSRYRRLLGHPPREALREIEPIEKSEVQADPEHFLDPTVPRAGTYVTSTGGTSGQPLTIILDKDGFQIEWAFMVAQWMRVGYRPGMRKATFRGVPFPRGRLWRENPVYDEMLFSPFAMSEENLARYVDVIQRFRPDFLYGYPSALTLLGRYLEAHSRPDFPRPKALLCGSENVREGQREFLGRVFSSRFFSWYGMSEKVILAGECEHTSLYHAFPQYGITEIRDREGNVGAEPGMDGELVGTGFMNTAMPFIRYRLGDFSRLEGDSCAACGRAFPLLGPVRGRWIQEMIVGRSGARISLTALNMHGEVMNCVRRFQFHQREAGRVILKIIPAASFSVADRERIQRALIDKTGSEIDWRIETVDTLELTARGKSVFLVQEIPADA